MKQNVRLYGALAAVAVFGVLQWQYNIIPIRASKASEVSQGVELAQQAPDLPIRTVHVDKLPLPGASPSTKPLGSPVRIKIWEWNAQMGLLYAVGGLQTTTGSLAEKYGVKVLLQREDDTEKSKAEQIKFANKLANGDPNPADGAHFVIIMGDQAAGYIATFNNAVKKLGPDYHAEVVGSVGWSGNDVSGEDTVMGTPDMKIDQNKLKGSLFAGAKGEGDWNILMVLSNSTGVSYNPDETTYDPDAINIVNADYLDAVKKYNQSYCEDRKVVHAGTIQPGKTQHKCVDGVFTWTPGDVNVVHGRGGLVKLLSTKEQKYQMPAVLIGVHKWDEAHTKTVANLLRAAFEAADQVSQYPEALERAGKAASVVYADQTPGYWVKYFKGVEERDPKTGEKVPLGGSRVSGLADNLVLFGLGSDGSGDVSSSMYRAPYEGFGNVFHQHYPKLLPSYPPIAEAVNLSALRSLASLVKPEQVEAATPKYEDTGAITDTVAKADFHINFATGSATILPDGRAQLDQIYNMLATNGLYVELGGHTDNTGNATANQSLSESRANAVRDYLVGRNPRLMQGKITAQGFGDTKPLAPNTTPDGRAANRRVTITLGTK